MKTYTKEEVINFVRWKDEPIYRAPNELSVRPRCVAQFPEYTTYIIIDKDGRLVSNPGEFLSLEQLFDIYILTTK